MGLPLQPDLTPWPLWLKRLTLVLALALATVIFGVVFGTNRRPPPQLLLSGPGHELDYARAVERLIANARQRINLVMFVARIDDQGPVKQIAEALAAAVKRGVPVTVVLDRGTDRITGQPDTKHEAPGKWLTDHGIQVVLDEVDRTTHAKTLVIDGHWCVIGSHNWTYSAMTGNREASLVIDDPVLGAELEAWFAAVPGWPQP